MFIYNNYNNYNNYLILYKFIYNFYIKNQQKWRHLINQVLKILKRIKPIIVYNLLYKILIVVMFLV
jgi:hypothetical protein